MPHTGTSHRHKALFIGLGAGVLIVIGAAVASVLLLSGAYSTAATKQHFRVTYRFLEMGLRYSVEKSADGIVVPDLQRTADIEVGAACYRSHCVQCHGAPGVARSGIGMGQLPSPSDLSQTGREWPPEQLFYVTQKGVRMSGMPAWQYRIAEGGLWSTVAFLQKQPFLTREEYAALAKRSEAKACPPHDSPIDYSEDNAHELLRQYACDNCHQMPGIVGPKTYVGPALHDFAQRKFIAGVLPNNHENLVRWLTDPQGVSPTTLMPDQGVPEAHARVMAQYFLGFE